MHRLRKDRKELRIIIIFRVRRPDKLKKKISSQVEEFLFFFFLIYLAFIHGNVKLFIALLIARKHKIIIIEALSLLYTFQTEMIRIQIVSNLRLFSYLYSFVFFLFHISRHFDNQPSPSSVECKQINEKKKRFLAMSLDFILIAL